MVEPLYTVLEYWKRPAAIKKAPIGAFDWICDTKAVIVAQHVKSNEIRGFLKEGKHYLCHQEGQFANVS